MSKRAKTQVGPYLGGDTITGTYTWPAQSSSITTLATGAYTWPGASQQGNLFPPALTERQARFLEFVEGLDDESIDALADAVVSNTEGVERASVVSVCKALKATFDLSEMLAKLNQK